MWRYTVRKVFGGVVLAWALVASAHAEGVTPASKIAILDPQAALWSSDDARKAVEKFKGEIKVQEDRMAELKKAVEGLSEKMRKDGSVMSEADKKSLQASGDAKYGEYQKLAQIIQDKSQKMQQEVISSLKGKLDKAIQDLQQANAYDLILDNRSVILARPDLDITKKVTEKINQAK